MSNFRRLSAIITALLIALSATNLASAQQGGSGLQISPTRNELIVNPGETKIVKLSIKNITSGPITVKGFVNDFISDGVTGEPRIVVDPNKKSDRSIKSYVKGLQDFDLAVNESRDVELSIDIPEGLAPGGYYGAVRYAAIPKSQDPNQDQSQQVALTASVATLMLVQVTGNANESVVIESLQVLRNGKASGFFTKSPTDISVKINNKGNTFAQPFGQVTITKGGKQIEKYQFNSTLPPGNVLPQSTRIFTDKIKSTDKMSSFGSYTVTADITYKQGGEALTITKKIWVVPTMILAIIAILFVMLIAAIAYISWRRVSSRPKKNK